MPYVQFQIDHDPDTAQRWQVNFLLPTGRSLQTVTVTALDASGVPVTDSFAVSGIQFASTPDALESNIWAVSFLASGGTPDTAYYIRIRITLNGDSVPYTDQTFRLNCSQT